MSDLAPFVAAALRDKVVSELHEEIRELHSALQTQRRQSQCVAITGPMGSPIYAQANFRDNGNFDYSPELWKVEFPTTTSICSGNNNNNNSNGGGCTKSTSTTATTTNTCTLAELADMEVRIGGIAKARLMTGGNGSIVEGFVNDVKNNYNAAQQSGAVSIWFGGSSGIWLTIGIQPIRREQYAALRDFDLGGDNLLRTLLLFLDHQPNNNNNNNNAPVVQVSFTEVSFLISYINGAMEQWGIPPEPTAEQEEEEAEETTMATTY
jgi:hypothetical protein